ncbi:MAG TPA: hypothetical protein VFP98_10755, partial [Candidatus Polarisedimenticolia bacterium]|nr:hypothetical protein [Candidatus Polarisedimenticolia bacterium]
LGRPADVDESVKSVPGVEVVPGGTVTPPGQALGRLDIHFGRGAVPACLAETIIIALEGCPERRTLGDNTKAENIEFFVRKAEELGFVVVDRVLQEQTGAGPAGAGDPLVAAASSGGEEG